MFRKIFFFAGLTAFIATSGYAQADSSDLRLAKIRTIGYQQSMARKLLYELSDVYGQRFSGSAEYFAAAKWASGKMKEFGLDNVHFENYCKNCRGWSVESFNVEMQSPNYMHLMAYPFAMSKSSPGIVEGDVLHIESFADMASIRQQYAGKLKGKVVLLGKEPQPRALPDSIFKRYDTKQLEFLEGISAPRVKQTPLKEQLEEWRKDYYEDDEFLRFVEAEGALAVFKASPSIAGVLNVGGTYYYLDNEPKPLPYFSVIPEHFGRMVRLLKQNIIPRVRLNLETSFYTEPGNNVNILGDITGTDPRLRSELLLVGGHFDSWHSGTGATDNGVSCMVWLEALRILKQSGLATKRTIRIAFWGGEELDFNGSVSYAKDHYGALGKPNAESGKVSAYLNLDNGAGLIRGLYLQGNEFARSGFEKIFAPFSGADKKYLTIENTLSTDHETFDNYNIPAFQFIQDPLSYFSINHHTTLDLPEYVPEADIKKNAVLLAWTIYCLANAESPVPRKMKN